MSSKDGLAASIATSESVSSHREGTAVWFTLAAAQADVLASGWTNFAVVLAILQLTFLCSQHQFFLILDHDMSRLARSAWQLKISAWERLVVFAETFPVTLVAFSVAFADALPAVALVALPAVVAFAVVAFPDDVAAVTFVAFLAATASQKNARGFHASRCTVLARKPD
jgi:hypothetical protein